MVVTISGGARFWVETASNHMSDARNSTSTSIATAVADHSTDTTEAHAEVAAARRRAKHLRSSQQTDSADDVEADESTESKGLIRSSMSTIATLKRAARAPCMTLYLVRHAESMNNKITYDHRQTGFGRYLRFADPDLSPLGVRQALLLGEHIKTGHEPIAEHLRHCAELGDRFALFCSPMRRTLKTTWGLAQGMGAPSVTVIPTAFEHGGCFHKFPSFADMKGLEMLLDAGDGAHDMVQAMGEKETHYPGLTAAEVMDPEFLSQYLGLDEPTDIFKSVESGMEHGWWHGRNAVESRKGCFERAAALAKRFVDMAVTDSKETVVLVSHGDLMDCLLKALLMPGLPAAVSDAACRFVHTNTGVTRVEIGRDGTAFLLKQNAHPHLDVDHELVTGGELVHDWDIWDRNHEQHDVELH